MADNNGSQIPGRIGMIAGKGMLPVVLALKIRELGGSVYAVGFKGITARSLRKHVDELHWIKLGQLNSILGYFLSGKIDRIVVGGLIKHAKIFENIGFDEPARKMFARMKDQRADSILGVFAEELEKNGIRLMSAADIIPGNMVAEGIQTGTIPDKTQLEDIGFGVGIAKGVAGLDIGQTIVVKNKAVIAVEAMEGTDKCILRGGKIAGDGTVVVKVSKPKQDFRFDMPVIGVRTINTMRKARARVLAVEAGRTILLEKDRVIKKADKYGISIVGHKG
jgi:UDP-2,3-diacylglucosamine hydrolase